MKIGIVGAGPAGLACAWRLAVDGHDVSVFEKKANLEAQGSGVIIQPSGLSVLAKWGLAQELEEIGAKLTRITGSSTYLSKITIDVDYTTLGNSSYALGLDRGVLWRKLHQRCLDSGVNIYCATPISGLFRDSDECIGFRSIDRDLEGLYDLVVDSSGAFSTLHSHAKRPPYLTTLDYGSLWTKVDLPADQPFDTGAMTLRSFRKNIGVGLMPIGRKNKFGPRRAAMFFNLKWRQVPFKTSDSKAENSLQSFNEWKAGLLEQWPEIKSLLCQLDTPDKLYLAKFNQLTVSPPFGDGIAFIGDAAHSSSPQLGQGINMSLIDAHVLSRALKQESCVKDALALYAKQRRLHVFLYQSLSRVLLPFYQSDNRLAIHLRDTFYPLLLKLPMMNLITAKLISGTLGWPFGRKGL